MHKDIEIGDKKDERTKILRAGKCKVSKKN